MAQNGNGNGNLTGLQQAFVLEYVKDWNQTQAAIRAGYKGSYWACAQRGHENLKNSKVQEAISELIADKVMEADEALARLADQARGTMDDFINVTDKGSWNVDLCKAQERGKLHLIEHIKPGPSGRGVDLRLYSAQTAIIKVLEAHGMFVKRIEGDLTITDKTEHERHQLLADIAREVADVESDPETGAG